MLMQCVPPSPWGSGVGSSDKIALLPAWPKEWDVSFKLHAPKNTTVECRVKEGQIVELVVTPESRRKDVEIHAPFSERTK